jgi:dihydrofolate synthase / folylpolyglutamate synthase
MLSYSETLEYLYNKLPVFQEKGAAALRDGLAGVRLFLNHVGNPHEHFKSIHIAGTNGKGSSSHMLASVLQEAGLKVGLYTSPHLVDFRERIRINGNKISQKYVQEFVHEATNFIEQNNFSFFELTVALAFKYFKEENIDIAIIEVGLGGEKDSTNVITPLVSLITNIGYDHVKILGNTLPEIAKAKAGIIKNNIPVVISTYQKDISDVFIQKAKLCNSKIIFANDEWTIESQKRLNKHQEICLLNIHSEDKKVCLLDLMGVYQSKNLLGVLSVINCLVTDYSFSISEKNIGNGLKNIQKNTGLQGRWQQVKSNPKTICDTGHNIDGIKEVVYALSKESYTELHIIIGFANDKDINEIVNILPKQAIYYFCKAKVFRALPASELKQIAAKAQLNGTSWESVQEAYINALKAANPSDLIFVGGSNFVVGDFLEFIEKK